MAALAALGCFLFVGSPTAEAGKGKDKEHKIHGKVTKIEADTGNKGVTWITIEVHHHHKKGAAPEANAQVSEVRRFKVTDKTTVVEKVAKGETKPASLDAVKDGTHVALKVHDDVVEELSIHHHHGKKKAA